MKMSKNGKCFLIVILIVLSKKSKSETVDGLLCPNPFILLLCRFEFILYEWHCCWSTIRGTEKLEKRSPQRILC